MTDDEMDEGLSKLISEAERDQERDRIYLDVGKRQAQGVRELIADLKTNIEIAEAAVNSAEEQDDPDPGKGALLACVSLAPALVVSQRKIRRIAELIEELPD